EVFSIDSDSGVLSFNISTRFKNPADSDGNNIYVVEITATDGLHSIVRSVTVTVTMAVLEVSVGTADIKTIRFEWPAYVDATSYKLLVNPDSASGFSLLQNNLSETSTTITLPVHLTDWINARYILEAYDVSGNKLTESAPVSITAMMLSSIGYVKASNTEAIDRFGSAVSLSSDGNTLAVGAFWEDSVATAACTGSSCSGENDNMAGDSGAVYVFSRNSNIWVQQAYVKASNTETGDWFGRTVSLSGDGNTLAVGADREDSAATGISTDANGENDNTAENAGAVYVFSRSDGVWSQQAYVKASNTGASDSFGEVVSLSTDGNTLAVGASGEDSAAIGISTSGEDDNTVENAGAVYVFSRSDGVWSQQAYVKASNTGAGDGFGGAVNLSGDGNTLAVGALGEDGAAGNSGAVYVFSLSSNVWSQQAYVKASNAGAGDEFGFAVSLSDDGNTLAVGARKEDSATTGISTDGSGEVDNTADSSGVVYVFSRSSNAWSQQAYVKASNTGEGDQFGGAVSLSGDGNTLVVGADNEDSGAVGISIDGSGEAGNTTDNSGAVYVFSRSGGIWSQQAYVKASNTGWIDNFGEAVSLSIDGNMLAVGAPLESSAATGISTGGSINNSASGAGAVYLY
ncbi:MAG: hyalin, partial [Gammaproteobacteria bacterium]|nr:hyalin [Gammaproteobacteria bacterium]